MNENLFIDSMEVRQAGRQEVLVEETTSEFEVWLEVISALQLNMWWGQSEIWSEDNHETSVYESRSPQKDSIVIFERKTVRWAFISQLKFKEHHGKADCKSQVYVTDIKRGEV